MTENASQSQGQSQTSNDTTANNNDQTTPNSVTEASTPQVILGTQPDDTNESQDTNESKEPETATNNENVDNVINIYSSGDEGILNILFNNRNKYVSKFDRIPNTDGTENADRKRQRLNSEQNEGQSTSNDNENETETESENREQAEGENWEETHMTRSELDTTTPPTESESSPIEPNEPVAEESSKYIISLILHSIKFIILLEKKLPFAK